VIRAPGNRTLTLSDEEFERYRSSLQRVESPVIVDRIHDKLFCQDIFSALPFLPDGCVDLLFADPPYNLTKKFNTRRFKKISVDDYTEWLDSWLSQIVRLLKPTASVYICGDWESSAAIHRVGEKYFIPRIESHGNAKRGAARSQTGKSVRKISGSFPFPMITTSTSTR
jgi:site-specific DNA-methyltransferase (adenine-specific)